MNDCEAHRVVFVIYLLVYVLATGPPKRPENRYLGTALPKNSW